MAVISTRDGEVWVVSRGGFALLIDRARGQLLNNPQLLNDLDAAKALDGLHLELMRERDRTSVTLALIASIDGLLTELDIQAAEPRVASYISLLKELRDLVTRDA